MARQSAEALLDSDPNLILPENLAFASELKAIINRTVDWSRIS
jgi:acyl-CoA synthetase (NDP forming)